MSSFRLDLSTLTPLTAAELEGYEDYQDLDEAAKRHPIVIDEYGVLRFQPDPFTVWLHDRSDAYLNALWADGSVPLDSIARHYRDIGYSLGGYHETVTVAYEEAAEDSARYGDVSTSATS